MCSSGKKQKTTVAFYDGQMVEDGMLSYKCCHDRLAYSRRSQSRMRGDYLFYEEKMETTQEEKDAKAVMR